jgi:hypothetical protein
VEIEEIVWIQSNRKHFFVREIINIRGKRGVNDPFKIERADRRANSGNKKWKSVKK